MNPKLVTAVIPIRNAEGKTSGLREAIKKQSGMSYVLVFDSCIDQTVNEFREILESRDAYHVRVLIGNYGSPGFARNAGLEEVKSDWVVFWDADDVPDPEVLLKTVKSLNQVKIEMIVTQYNRSLYNSNQSPVSNSRTYSKFVLALDPGIWRIIFKVNNAKRFRFEEFRMGEDQCFIAQFMTSKPRIVFSRATTYSYFQGVPGQLTSNKTAKTDLKLTFFVLVKLIIKNRDNRFFLATMALRQSLGIFKQLLNIH